MFTLYITKINMMQKHIAFHHRPSVRLGTIALAAALVLSVLKASQGLSVVSSAVVTPVYALERAAENEVVRMPVTFGIPMRMPGIMSR